MLRETAQATSLIACLIHAGHHSASRKDDNVSANKE